MRVHDPVKLPQVVEDVGGDAFKFWAHSLCNFEPNVEIVVWVGGLAGVVVVLRAGEKRHGVGTQPAAKSEEERGVRTSWTPHRKLLEPIQPRMFVLLVLRVAVD